MRPLALLVLAVVAVGCGKDASPEVPSKGGGDEPRAVAASASGGEPASPDDEVALRRVADKYLRAITAQDWRAACQTRTPQDRRELAGVGGSCPAALRATAQDGAEFAPLLGGRTQAGTVEVRGDRAAVPVFQPAQEEAAVRVYAQRQPTGRWLLVSVSEDEEDSFLAGG